MAVLKVTSNDFEKEVLKSEKEVLVDFNADWCGPCRMLAPELERMANENDFIKIVSLNVDNEGDLANKYNVFSIPCLVLFKDGKEVKRNVGFISQEELTKFIGE